MVALNRDELLDALQVVRMVRQRVEGVGNADVVVGPVGAFADHEVRGDPSHVCLVGQHDQIEHQTYLLVEIRQLTDRCVGQLDTGEIALRCLFDAALRLAHGFQIVAQNGAVPGTQTALQLVCALVDEVENAARTSGNRLALFRRVAGAE